MDILNNRHQIAFQLGWCSSRFVIDISEDKVNTLHTSVMCVFASRPIL